MKAMRDLSIEDAVSDLKKDKTTAQEYRYPPQMRCTIVPKRCSIVQPLVKWQKLLIKRLVRKVIHVQYPTDHRPSGP